MNTFPYNNSTIVLHPLLQEGETSPCFSTYPHSNKSKTCSSSMVLEFDCDDPKETCTEEKRRNKDDSCLSSAQSQDKRGIKTRKQRKCNTSRKEETEKKKKKIHQEPPTEYIHVRARRGQATDSHSLAERVRREKISERMRLLQGLVPGCDKVTGKATMLDEIINYVQSLQYQVEFLSMKLASVNPVVHDFATDINALMFKPEPERMSGSMASSAVVLPSMQQSSGFANMISTSTTKNNYSHQDNALPFLPQHGQMLTAFSESQDNENVYGQRQRLVNQYQYGFNNLCSFQ